MAITAASPVRKELTPEEQRALMEPIALRYVPSLTLEQLKALEPLTPEQKVEMQRLRAEAEELARQEAAAEIIARKELRPWPTHEELLAQRLAPFARPSPERGLVEAARRGDAAVLTPSMRPHATFLQRELQRTTDLIGEYRNYIISKYKIDPERFIRFSPGDADIELGKEICQRQYNFIRVIRYGTPEIVEWEEEAPLAAMPFARPPIAQKYAPIIT